MFVFGDASKFCENATQHKFVARIAIALSMLLNVGCNSFPCFLYFSCCPRKLLLLPLPLFSVFTKN